MTGNNSSASSKISSITSVYYLSSSDSPGMLLSQIILNGENYHVWKKAFQRALRSKNKLSFIDGTLDKTKADDSDKNAWDKCNAMVVSWIYNCVDKSIQNTIVSFDDARELWTEIQQRYHQGHGPRIYQLKGELNEFRQWSLNVTYYYAKLKGIWDQLDQYTKADTCVCGSTCRTLINMLEERENEKVYKVFMGLDDRYDTNEARSGRS
ncbi:PREDICTED: uncharacterized protein LOC109115747 [Nelumbo nucifera]|uniref:Uncharacterized protein LOC109115747 n=1 Tax=Nelumbo nucifera TaxID=4432 RepID=A0A1U8QA13_NELNU|nr:PREDICTED: uncharacterized protein LOC109115747 [Nelumbo nucifera]